MWPAALTSIPSPSPGRAQGACSSGKRPAFRDTDSCQRRTWLWAQETLGPGASREGQLVSHRPPAGGPAGRSRQRQARPRPAGAEAGGTGAQAAGRSARSVPPAASQTHLGSEGVRQSTQGPPGTWGRARGGDLAQPRGAGDGACQQWTRPRWDGSGRETNVLNLRSDVSGGIYSVFENYFRAPTMCQAVAEAATTELPVCVKSVF